MKYTLFKIAAAVAVLASFCSCSLEEDTSGLSNPEDYFRKYAECQSVVNSCYIPMKSIYTYTMMLATECVTDVAFCNSGTLDARLDISPATPRHGTTVWTNGYLGVQRCNFAINGIEKAYENGVLDDDEYYQILCEAKAMRAYYYWLLTCFFGNVPFYFDDVSDAEVLERIQVLPRMDANATRDACIEDLQSIAPYAPQTRTSDNDGARAGASLAYLMIAKMAMWNEEWEVALDALQSLEKIYGDLSQYDYAENVMFRNKNTPESILEIQHTYTEGGLQYTSNVASISMPYPRTANSAIYDGVEITELGDNATAWTAMRPTSYFYSNLQKKGGSDLRAPYNMAWEYNGQTFSSNTTWIGPKFWCLNLQTTLDGNNYKLFRYADAILMMAECYFELGDTEQAQIYLNMTRNRAGIGDYTYRTDARLQDEIRNERARELFGEFQRKFDLVRWGIWYESVTLYTDNTYLMTSSSTSYIKPCHRYYPIPDTEVVLSKYNLDNNEYNAYGL